VAVLDRALVGGLVVTPTESRLLDIGIKDEKIVMLVEPGSLPDAADVIDVTGRTIVPGGIDPHVHCDLSIEDPEGGPPAVSSGPDVVSKAALIGGTTGLIDFVWKDQDDSIEKATAKVDERWASSCASDYSFHIVLRGIVTRETLAQMPDAIAAGYPSFKVFTTNVFPHDAVGGVPLKIDFGSLKEVMEINLEHGGIASVHAEDDDLVQHMYRQLAADNRMEYTNMPEVHSSLSEDLSFRRVIRLAEKVGGSPLYFMHVSAATGVDAIAEARAKGLPVFGETLHQYALHTQQDYFEHDGMKYHTYPSLKEPADTDRLWQGVAEKDISTFATDEQCTSYAIKTQGRRVDDVVGGNTGIEPRMAILYSEIVDRRGMSLQRFAEATSTNAAKIFGLYPQKGAIQVGADADLVALETGIQRTVTSTELHESDYTPWEGWQVTAWPQLTLLRGEVVARDGSFVGDPNGGRRVIRRISDAVRTGNRYV
jgi:dihydropyrimidinase